MKFCVKTSFWHKFLPVKIFIIVFHSTILHKLTCQVWSRFKTNLNRKEQSHCVKSFLFRNFRKIPARFGGAKSPVLDVDHQCLHQFLLHFRLGRPHGLGSLPTGRKIPTKDPHVLAHFPVLLGHRAGLVSPFRLDTFPHRGRTSTSAWSCLDHFGGTRNLSVIISHSVNEEGTMPLKLDLFNDVLKVQTICFWKIFCPGDSYGTFSAWRMSTW